MRWLLLATVALLPSVALAQQVPAINAVAAAGIRSAPPTTGVANGGTVVVVPPGLPPTNRPLSPSASLLPKEKVAASLSQAWRDHNDKPVRGEDGVLRWVYGASQPSVVCAPLESCDVALQPGEIVRNVNAGDKVRWSISPAVSGSGSDRTTHVVVKPSDAGLVTSLLVYTDKRVYSIKLVSVQKQYTPMTAFSYPSDSQEAWAQYGATMSSASAAPAATGGGAGPVDLNYRISGSASWRPEHVYAQGGKTYICFPHAMQYGTAPALIGLANDGGWFSSASQQMVRYRVVGDKYVVDGLIDHAMLVTGVGGGQTRVDIRRSN